MMITVPAKLALRSFHSTSCYCSSNHAESERYVERFVQAEDSVLMNPIYLYDILQVEGPFRSIAAVLTDWMTRLVDNYFVIRPQICCCGFRRRAVSA